MSRDDSQIGMTEDLVPTAGDFASSGLAHQPLQRFVPVWS